MNIYTTSHQRDSDVAADSAGNFVVVWTSFAQDGSHFGVFGRRYVSSGAPLGGEFLVNTYTTSYQESAAVATDPSGNFVVVWGSSSQDGSGLGVFGQRYASSGTPLGPEFRVNTFTTYSQSGPSVAADSSGNFVVVWVSRHDGSSFGIFGQRYASSGSPLGPEFRVNTYTTDGQAAPSVAADSSGNFVVVWANYVGTAGLGIFGQRYASSGTPLGPEFHINTSTAIYHRRPAVASDSAGNFVVVWVAYDTNPGVFGQRYASSGTPLGPEFRLNTSATNLQGEPDVAAGSSGGFVVVWYSYPPASSSSDVYGQRYASSGTPLGSEFRVNTHTPLAQRSPSVAGEPSGNFVVAWDSYNQDGWINGVFGQRFGQAVAVTLSVTDSAVAEGDAGSVNAVFTVSLSAAAPQTVTVQYATADVTAVAGLDYTAGNGTVTFPPGTTSQPISVPVLGDLLDEDDETFTVNLSNPTNATIADGQGLGIIVDNDPMPALSALDCLALEGNFGSNPCPFNVVLTPVSGRTVTVAYATADGTATAGSDYTAASGTLTFPAGTTQRTVNVDVLGDTVAELNETYFVNLSGPTNATLGDPQGMGIITNDDVISLSSLEVSHGTDLRADLAGGTPDLYRISQQPLSSYEVLVDDAAGDLVPGLLLERLASDGSTVAQTGVPVGTGSALSLRWENALGGSIPVNGEHVRLRSLACGTACGADDVYRMRVYDTTLTVARFNNAGSQVTVLLLQNPTGQSVSGHLYFWGAPGPLLHIHQISLPPRTTLVLNTAAVFGLQGLSGSVTVAHDAPYGALVGKTVALEPATGFSFDSPLEPRPR